jgi:hypothetical protein
VNISLHFYVTRDNGHNRFYMFICISLGSSTVQLHDSLGSRRACAGSGAVCSSQIGDRA